MKLYSRSLLLFTFLLMLLPSSCKKSNSEPEAQPQKSLFTVEFADNYIKKNLSGFILVSDPQGNYLGDTVCTVNRRYPVYLRNAVPVPALVTVTVGFLEVDMHTLIVHLNSFTGVNPNGEWKITGSRPDTLGHARVSLTNLPLLSGPVIYSNSGYSNMTFITADAEQMLYVSPDDLYIKIKTQAGERYKWVPGISLSGSYTIDMAGTTVPEFHSVTFPMNVQDYDVTLAGYKGNEYESPLAVVTDRIISDANVISNVSLAYPPSVFSGFVTDMMIRETYASDLQWFFHTDGAIPDEFVKINASINSVTASAGHASMDASGTYTMSVVGWEFQDYTGTRFDWNIAGPGTSSELTLPLVSPLLQKVFPTLNRDSMRYVGTELRFYPNLTGYPDVLDVLYGKDRLHSAGDFEMRSVRKNAMTKKVVKM
jgi:hypothetical protein